MINLNSLKLYAITDSKCLQGDRTLEEAVEQAILGGITMLQYREKNLDYAKKKEEAISLHNICKRYGIPFVVNDDVKLAKEIDADGVHVGADDMSEKEARAILGASKIVGATAKTLEQVDAANSDGADYIGSGAVFGTITKADAKPMSRELLDEICMRSAIPVVAIGGICLGNIIELNDAKISGVAVVSGIFGQNNIRVAAEKLYAARYGKKVIQCITNHVTVNEVANVVLAVNASPIMAHHVLEVEEIQGSADALLLNLGSTDEYDAMEIAYKTALDKKHPIVIDPVGVGGSSYRRQFLKKLLSIGSPTCIRGNFGEIQAILSDDKTMRGLDYDGGNRILAGNSPNTAASIACSTNQEHIVSVSNLAKKLGCLVVCSGAVDIISDGDAVFLVESGSVMQKNVTGSGCMLSAIICAKLAQIVGRMQSESASKSDIESNKTDNLSIAHYLAGICQMVGDAAAKAAECSHGNMSFLMNWLDEISAL